MHSLDTDRITNQIDQIPAGAVVFVSAPAGVFNAVYGGLMSGRAKCSGAAGTVVDGCFRDLQEHRELGYPVFAKDISTPSFYEVARPSEVCINDHLWKTADGLID